MNALNDHPESNDNLCADEVVEESSNEASVQRLQEALDPLKTQIMEVVAELQSLKDQDRGKRAEKTARLTDLLTDKNREIDRAEQSENQTKVLEKLADNPLDTEAAQEWLDAMEQGEDVWEHREGNGTNVSPDPGIIKTLTVDLDKASEADNERNKERAATDAAFKAHALIIKEQKQAEVDKAWSQLASETDPAKAKNAIRKWRYFRSELDRVPPGIPTIALKTKKPPTQSAVDWILPGWIPGGGLVTSLYSGPGVGKSRLAMQLAATVAYGGTPMRLSDAANDQRSDIEANTPGLIRDLQSANGGKVLVLNWEDSAETFDERWTKAFNAGLIGPSLPTKKRKASKTKNPYTAESFQAGALPGQMPGDMIDFVHMAEAGPLFAPGGSSRIAGAGEWTDTGHWLLHRMLDYRLIVIDPLGAAFGCDENDRRQVQSFFSGLTAKARDANCGVLLVGHPNKESLKARGTSAEAVGAYSGSTAWEGAVRSMFAIEKEQTGYLKPRSEKNSKNISDQAHGWRVRLLKTNLAGGDGDEKLGASAWLRNRIIERQHIRTHYGLAKDSNVLAGSGWEICTAQEAAAWLNRVDTGDLVTSAAATSKEIESDKDQKYRDFLRQR